MESDAYFPRPDRGDIVSLVYNQKVITAGIGGLIARWESVSEESQRALALEDINRGDQAWEMRPRIDMYPPLLTELTDGFTVNYAKLQAELVAHLVFPLDL